MTTMVAKEDLPPDYFTADRGDVLVHVIIAFTVVETVFFCLYLASRYIGQTLRGWDVYLMYPSYILQVANSILGLFFVLKGGGGRHVGAVSREEIEYGLKGLFAVEFIYDLAVVLPKLSLLFFYLRIFSMRYYRYAIFATITFVVLTIVSVYIGNLAICRPVAFNWDKSIKDGHCGDILAFFRYVSVPNLTSDLMILLLPIYGVWKLQLPIIKRIGLTCVFLTGCIGTVTGILRLVSFLRTDLFKDLTWNATPGETWTIVEPSMYMIASTLPSMGPLLKTTFRGAKSKLSYSGTKHSNTGFSKSTGSSTYENNRQAQSVIVKQTTIATEETLREPGFNRLDDHKAHSSDWHHPQEGMELV